MSGTARAPWRDAAAGEATGRPAAWPRASRTRASAPLLAVLVGVLAAPAASVASPPGSTVLEVSRDGWLAAWGLRPAAATDSPSLVGRAASGLDTSGLLAWERVDQARGTAWKGVLRAANPREAGFALGLNPVTDDLYLVHGIRLGGASELAVRSWLGQRFSEPRLGTAAGGLAIQPSLAFTASGEALLAWRQGDSGATLVKHHVLTPDGESHVYSFVNIDSASVGLTGFGPGMGLSDGLVMVTSDAEGEVAYVLQADAAAGAAGVIALRLAVLEDIWGGNALPVPVTLSPEGIDPLSTCEPGPGSPPATPTPSTDLASWAVDLERAVVRGHEVYYWLEDDRVQALAFRGGRLAIPLVTIARPARTEMAHQAILEAVVSEVVGRPGRPANTAHDRRTR